MRIRLIITFLLLATASLAQKDSAFSFTGYAEAYFVSDAGNPATDRRLPFLYNHADHKKPALNLAFAKAAYNKEKFRANLALMYGDYRRYNLAAEPDWAAYILEANAGIRLSAKNEVWLDAGVLPSHIGFESAVGLDCATLSRSLVAETSPYFETGVRLSATSSNGKLYVAALALRGWQRIQPPDGYTGIAAGIQITLKPNDKLTLNYSNFLGNDRPDSLRQHRIYHDIYALWQPSAKWSITAGFDVGTEKRINQEGFNTWLSPTLIAAHRISDKWKAAARLEYFKDKNEVIVTGIPGSGFATLGYSFNLDWSVHKYITARAEWRQFNSRYNLFEKSGAPTGINTAFQIALIGKIVK